MALMQMANYNEPNNQIHILENQIAELQNKLHSTELALATTANERDHVASKVQAALTMIEQRDASIQSIQDRVQHLITIAEDLQAENKRYREEIDNLNNCLAEKQKRIENFQQAYASFLSNADIAAKLDALESRLNAKLSSLNDIEQAYLEKIEKVEKPTTVSPSDTVYQMKVLSTLNAIDQTTSKLRNYNDAKSNDKLDTINQKLDKIVGSNKMTIVYAACLLAGVILARMLIK